MSITKLNNLSISAVTALPSGVGGKVLQVVSTTKTDTFNGSGDTFVDITGLSVSITPTSASNKVFIIANISGAGNNDASLKLLRGSTDICIGASAGSRSRITTALERGLHETPAVSITFLDSPSTTSSITYKVQVNGYNDYSINRENSDSDNASTGRSTSTITVMEIAP